MSEYIFKLPDLGEGTVESEISEWAVAVGDVVSEEDVVGTMMTDKAAVELSSPVSGKVVKLAGEPGDMIAVGAPLVIFETDATASETTSPKPAAPAKTSQPAAPVKPAPPAAAAPAPAAAPVVNSKVITSPAIRLRAREAGVDLHRVPGSGPGGRIVRADFDAFVARGGAGTTAGSAAPRPVAATTETKVIGLRRLIAERMTASKREIPHFAYVEEIDITELEALRNFVNGKRDAAARLTPLPFIGLALIRALRQFPQCNATYDKERNVIVRHGPVHLGIATQTPDGLKVPVVHNSEQLDVDALSANIRRVAAAARDNSIGRNELSGSTITLTSLGKLGGIASTPVINQPEVAIVGVNRAVLRPMVINGQIVPRLMMNLSSSFDHRFVDGHDAAAMIQLMREMLEYPATLFADFG